MKGIDTAQVVTAIQAKKLKFHGYSFIGRYLKHQHGELTKNEVNIIHAAGLKILSIWESGNPTEIDYFSNGKGASDAHEAVAKAKNLGQPHGTAIFHTEDFDPSYQQITNQILEYAKEFNPINKQAGYLTGCYGSGLTCHSLVSLGHVHYTWQDLSTGHTGHNVYPVDVKQYISQDLFGLNCDLNLLASDKQEFLW